MTLADEDLTALHAMLGSAESKLQACKTHARKLQDRLDMAEGDLQLIKYRVEQALGTIEGIQSGTTRRIEDSGHGRRTNDNPEGD